ncbi:MAG: flippase activity-associated protein Agl23 [Akkermansiaceae bacterium]
MKQVVVIICWISVIATGIFLRFDQLSKRPFHADEATGARITASRMESGDYRFDPFHYHGPTLSSLAIPLCQTRGETRWRDMTKLSPRLLPATAGSLLLLVPLLWRRRFGDTPVLLAAALLATSPLLVYYSRMFIHEMLLALFGMLALACLIRFPRYGIPGLLIGLMFATKESFAISIIAWTAAGLLIAWEYRKSIDRGWCLATWQQYKIPVAISFLAAALSSGYFYTDGFRHPNGAIDAIKTFFVYETGDGHDKPLAWYLQLLTLPVKSGGFWWFGTPVALLALFAYISSFRRDSAAPAVTRFLAYAAAGHLGIYSLIAYKTPWLACLPWAHVCLLAGIAVAGFPRHRLPLQATLGLLAGAAIITQFTQARRAAGRFASDERNPFAYVPTRNDIESLEPFLAKLRLTAPQIPMEPVAIIGTDYWPLPWYLRSFEKIGYWPAPPEDLETRAIVISMPDTTAAVMGRLGATHVPLPRGLRAGVPIHLFVRNDVWQLWMETDR